MFTQYQISHLPKHFLRSKKTNKSTEYDKGSSIVSWLLTTENEFKIINISYCIYYNIG